MKNKPQNCDGCEWEMGATANQSVCKKHGTRFQYNEDVGDWVPYEK